MVKTCDEYRSTELTITGLRCGILGEPLGLTDPRPVFSWALEHPGRAVYQKAYRILVSSDPLLLRDDVGDMWDSGVIRESGTLGIRYGGETLGAVKAYHWAVRVWDTAGGSSTSQPSRFTMGPLSQEDWGGAEWVGAPEGVFHSQPLLRKEFVIRGPVKSAIAFIAGIGYHELHINGQKVGDSVLDPGWTDYRKRVLFVTHDVTDYLRTGSNALGVMLGNGWYCTEHYGGTPKALLCISIDHGDGTRTRIASRTGDGWHALEGPITSDGIYSGETYDARLEKPGWCLPVRLSGGDAFADAVDAVAVEGPPGQLVPQLMEPMMVVDEVVPVSVTNPKPGVYVFDMGVNMAGWVRLNAIGPRGTSISVRYSETLFPDGTVNQENLRTARSTDTYVMAGTGAVENHSPRFTYHGFRYVQIEGYPGTPGLDSVTGCLVRTAAELTGSFECDNDMLNRLHQCVVRTEGNNIHGLPTDCPQRDERMGWLNDMTVRAEEAVYNFRIGALYRKWMDDIDDTQDPETGGIGDTAPFIWGHNPADPVSSSYVLIPWLLYLHYGDKEVLAEHYEGIKGWVRCLGSMAQDGIVGFSRYGDWAGPIAACIDKDYCASKVTPGPLVSTGFLYLDLTLMARIAGVLGLDADREAYVESARLIKDAFNEAFFDKAAGRYAEGSQGSNTLALYLGLVPDASRNAVVSDLLRGIMEEDYHLTTGNLCSRLIFDVLADTGHIDDAFRLVTQTTYPSWGYMMAMGATTIWERWEYETGGAMNSHDHPMYGAIGSWLYKILAGISPDEDGPGYGKIKISPHFPKGLNQVSSSLQTVRGTVASEWRRSDVMEMAVTVPCNCTAEIRIPANMLPARVYEGGEFLGMIDVAPETPKGTLGVQKGEGCMTLTVGSGRYIIVGCPLR